MPGASGSPAPKMRTSADSSQAEIASLESCSSASSAHGAARTESQRLGLLACLATSNFKRSLGMARVPARLLSQPFSENESVFSYIAARIATLESCCSASSACSTACTEAQRLGLLACLATSNVKRKLGRPCQVHFAALL